VGRHIEGVPETKLRCCSRLIAEPEASGRKVRPFCRERGVTEPSFYYWRKRLRKRETVRFALLATTPAGTGSTVSALELVLKKDECCRPARIADAQKGRWQAFTSGKSQRHPPRSPHRNGSSQQLRKQSWQRI